MKLWRRTLKVYSYHLLMLTFAFTAAAAFAARTHRPALYNLLNFYLAHPVVAIIGSVLLIYCPPLLDILPMYVIFLFFTPMALTDVGSLWLGWILAGSGMSLGRGAVWVEGGGCIMPWCCDASADSIAGDGRVQPVCVAGGLGGGAVAGGEVVEGEMPLARVPGWAVALCGAICTFFFEVRHGWLGPHLTQEIAGDTASTSGRLDRCGWSTWRQCLIVCYWLRRYFVRVIAREPFLTLGKASLQVFCAHVLLCVCGAGAVVWRYSAAAWVAGLRNAGADVYWIVSGGGAGGEAAEGRTDGLSCSRRILGRQLKAS